MGRKVVALGLVALTFMLLLVSEPLPVHAASGLVQQNNNGCSSCTSTTLAVAFSSNVVAGDVIVAATYGKPSAIPSGASVSDSRGSSFTFATYSEDGTDEVNIFYATITSSGADTVTATLPGTVGQYQNLYIYEVSGVITAGATVGNDAAGSGTSISTSSVTFQSGAFLLGIIGAISPTRTVTPNLAALTLSPDNSVTGLSHVQYATSGVSSPTTFPATGSASGQWAEAGLALNPGVNVIKSTTSTLTTVVATLVKGTTTTATSTAPASVTVTSTSVSSTTQTSTLSATVTQTSTSTTTATVTTVKASTVTSAVSTIIVTPTKTAATVTTTPTTTAATVSVTATSTGATLKVPGTTTGTDTDTVQRTVTHFSLTVPFTTVTHTSTSFSPTVTLTTTAGTLVEPATTTTVSKTATTTTVTTAPATVTKTASSTSTSTVTVLKIVKTTTQTTAAATPTVTVVITTTTCTGAFCQA